MKHNGGTIRKTPAGYIAYIYFAHKCTAHRADTLHKAKKWIDDNVGPIRAGWAPLSHCEMQDYHAAMALLPAGSTILDAARAYAASVAKTPCPTTSEAWAAFFADKTAAGLRPRTLQQTRFLVSRLARQYGAERIDALSAARLSAYLSEIAQAAVTRNNYRRAWGTFFGWAIARGHIARNPVDGITVARQEAPPVGILTPKQVGALMVSSVGHGGSMTAYLAFGLFAGVRTAELMRLQWTDISSAQIHIRSATSKMGEERYVAIRPPLDRWIAKCRRRKGPICPVAISARDRRLTEIRESAKVVEWPPNAMRHSYASYLLAQTGDSALVAHQLGHHDPDTTWRHYRHLVEKAQADAYFSILPAK
jgi:integrase